MMSKYEIIKKDMDLYVLKYNDKEIEFKSDINVISKMQKANKQARIKMISDLSKEGVSLKNFIIEQKKNGKTYFDNTNKVELENTYIEEEITNVFNDICKEKLGNDIMQITKEIGLETEEEITQFSKEIAEALTGNTPRR